MQAADSVQIRDYFKVLQNQEKLRAGEIINALPTNDLSRAFEQVNESEFLEKVGYAGLGRNDLEKVYCSVLGAWFGKMQLNSADRKVVDFVDGMNELDEAQQAHVSNLNDGIECIAKMPSSVAEARGTKRMIKLLFGLALFRPGFFGTDTLSKVEFVCRTSSKLAAFNSSESEEVAFSKYFGDEYVCDRAGFVQNRAPRYRKVFSAVSKSASKADLEEALGMLLEDCESHLSGRMVQ